MQRTQISLTTEDRRVLDAAAARTGKSIAALIREAVATVYGPGRRADVDRDALRGAFGTWGNRGIDGAEWVEKLRRGDRLEPRR